MNELIQLSERVYYIDSPTKVGIIKASENEVYLIDSGNNKDAGRRLKKLLDERGWTLGAIYNTHSHADHIGANRYLYEKTACKIYATEPECGPIRYPMLEPMIIFGGNPPDELRHRFLLADPSPAEILTEDKLTEGWEMIPLGGHAFGMVGFRVDGFIFLADALCSPETLAKYSITYLTDVESYLQTLEKIKEYKGQTCIPSHAPACDDISPLAEYNLQKVHEVIELILGLLTEPMTDTELLCRLFDAYSLTPTYEQYFLVGSTMRSYLTYLKKTEQVECAIEGGRLLWKKTDL